jgi:hypothetical protein
MDDPTPPRTRMTHIRERDIDHLDPGPGRAITCRRMAPNPTMRGVFGRVMATVRRHWRLLVLVALVVFVPLGLLDVLDERFAALDPDELRTEDTIGRAVIAVTRALTELFGEIVLAGVIAAAIGDVYGPGEPRSLREVLRGIPYLRLVAITVLSVVGFTLGLLLLIAPGIVFLGLFGLASPVAEVEDVSVRRAFARSYELSRRHIALVLAFLIPLTLVSDVAIEAAQEAGVTLLGEGLAGEWLGAIIGGILTSTPWALAAVALVYELKAGEGDGGTPAGSRSSPPPPR